MDKDIVQQLIASWITDENEIYDRLMKYRTTGELDTNKVSSTAPEYSFTPSESSVVNIQDEATPTPASSEWDSLMDQYSKNFRVWNLLQGFQKYKTNYDETDTAWEFATNAALSWANLIGGAADAILHPVDTISLLWKWAVGWVANAATKILGKNEQDVKDANPWLASSIDTANDIGKSITEGYTDETGWFNLKKKLVEDPFGLVSDVSTVLSGWAMAAAKAGKLGASVTKNLGKVAAKGLTKATLETLRDTGKITDNAALAKRLTALDTAEAKAAAKLDEMKATKVNEEFTKKQTYEDKLKSNIPKLNTQADNLIKRGNVKANEYNRIWDQLWNWENSTWKELFGTVYGRTVKKLAERDFNKSDILRAKAKGMQDELDISIYNQQFGKYVPEKDVLVDASWKIKKTFNDLPAEQQKAFTDMIRYKNMTDSFGKLAWGLEDFSKAVDKYDLGIYPTKLVGKSIVWLNNVLSKAMGTDIAVRNLILDKEVNAFFNDAAEGKLTSENLSKQLDDFIETKYGVTNDSIKKSLIQGVKDKIKEKSIKVSRGWADLEDELDFASDNTFAPKTTNLDTYTKSVKRSLGKRIVDENTITQKALDLAQSGETSKGILSKFIEGIKKNSKDKELYTKVTDLVSKIKDEKRLQGEYFGKVERSSKPVVNTQQFFEGIKQELFNKGVQYHLEDVTGKELKRQIDSDRELGMPFLGIINDNKQYKKVVIDTYNGAAFDANKIRSTLQDLHNKLYTENDKLWFDNKLSEWEVYNAKTTVWDYLTRESTGRGKLEGATKYEALLTGLKKHIDKELTNKSDAFKKANVKYSKIAQKLKLVNEAFDVDEFGNLKSINTFINNPQIWDTIESIDPTLKWIGPEMIKLFQSRDAIKKYEKAVDSEVLNDKQFMRDFESLNEKLFTEYQASLSKDNITKHIQEGKSIATLSPQLIGSVKGLDKLIESAKKSTLARSLLTDLEEKSFDKLKAKDIEDLKSIDPDFGAMVKYFKEKGKDLELIDLLSKDKTNLVDIYQNNPELLNELNKVAPGLKYDIKRLMKKDEDIDAAKATSFEQAEKEVWLMNKLEDLGGNQVDVKNKLGGIYAATKFNETRGVFNRAAAASLVFAWMSVAWMVGMSVFNPTLMVWLLVASMAYNPKVQYALANKLAGIKRYASVYPQVWAFVKAADAALEKYNKYGTMINRNLTDDKDQEPYNVRSYDSESIGRTISRNAMGGVEAWLLGPNSASNSDLIMPQQTGEYTPPQSDLTIPQ